MSMCTSSSHTQSHSNLCLFRAHVSKLRKTHGKTRRYIRQLLEVIQTYEELPAGLSVAADGSRLSNPCYSDGSVTGGAPCPRTGPSVRYTQGVESEGTSAADVANRSVPAPHHARHKPTLPSSPPDLGRPHTLQQREQARVAWS